jgi:hypothetical protein
MEKILAQIVKTAAETHEKSWSKKSSTYRISIEEASNRMANGAGHPGLARPVYLLLKYTWNDVLDWADNLLDQK